MNSEFRQLITGAAYFNSATHCVAPRRRRRRRWNRFLPLYYIQINTPCIFDVGEAGLLKRPLGGVLGAATPAREVTGLYDTGSYNLWFCVAGGA